jgi:protoheme IX farnesyltransferase
MATDIFSVDAATTMPRESVCLSGCSEAMSAIGAGQGSGLRMEASAAPSRLHARDDAGRSVSGLLSDYVQLTKPRIVVMILVTTMSTAMIGAGGLVPAVELLWLFAGTAAVAASAGAANQLWERVIDRRMTRTANRPLPAGRVGVVPAAVFTAVLGVLGTLLLHFLFGPRPALVGVWTWLLYVLVYTPMKTRTAWNTTVGAIAGALPVLIGYTAMDGSLAAPVPWLLVGVLVAWQYPHFMSIAWIYRRQYAEAGFCMSTTVEPSGRSAGLQSVAGSLALLGCGVVICCIPAGWFAAVAAVSAVCASGTPMLLSSIRFAREPSDARARRLLRSSLLVLPAVLAIVTLRLVW